MMYGHDHITSHEAAQTWTSYRSSSIDLLDPPILFLVEDVPLHSQRPEPLRPQATASVVIC